MSVQKFKVMPVISQYTIPMKIINTTVVKEETFGGFLSNTKGNNKDIHTPGTEHLRNKTIDKRKRPHPRLTNPLGARYIRNLPPSSF